MKLIIPICLLATFVIAGCVDCGPQKELTAQIGLHSTDSLSLKKVYARKAVGEITIQQSDGPEGTYYEMEVPISMHEDQTTYIFEFENRTDSLTLFYKREFYYKDACGFVVDVDPKQIPNPVQSTFSIADVSSTPYVGRHKNSITYQSEGGIFININQ